MRNKYRQDQIVSETQRIRIDCQCHLLNDKDTFLNVNLRNGVDPQFLSYFTLLLIIVFIISITINIDINF